MMTGRGRKDEIFAVYVECLVSLFVCLFVCLCVCVRVGLSISDNMVNMLGAGRAAGCFRTEQRTVMVCSYLWHWWARMLWEDDSHVWNPRGAAGKPKKPMIYAGDCRSASSSHSCVAICPEVRRKPYSLVLFDEVEKAHPDVFNLMCLGCRLMGVSHEISWNQYGCSMMQHWIVESL